MTDESPRPLRRDVQKGWLGGVCAGFAEFFGLDATVVRVLYVLLTVFTAFAGVLVYIILWVVIPARQPAASPQGNVPQQR